jgi:hypothetical protein
MNNRTKYGLILALAAAAAVIPFSITSATAQNTSQTPPPAGPQGVRGQFQGQGGPDAFRPMLNNGGSALVSEGDWIFVMQGNRIFKISKNDMRIYGQTDLSQAARPANRPGGGGTGGGQE